MQILFPPECCTTITISGDPGEFCEVQWAACDALCGASARAKLGDGAEPVAVLSAVEQAKIGIKGQQLWAMGYVFAAFLKQIKCMFFSNHEEGDEHPTTILA